MRSITLCSLLLLVGGPVAAKDLALHRHVTPTGSTAPYDTTEYLTPSLRIVDGPLARTIIDAKARTVTVFDKEAKTYWLVSFDSLRRQTARMEQGRDSEIDSRVGEPVTLAPTGTTDTIAGHPCEENVFQGGKPAGSVCIAKDLESPADPALWGDWPGLGTRLGVASKVMDAVGTKRVALRTILNLSARVSMTTVTTAVREESPDPGLTAIPKDYAQATRFSSQR